MLLWIAAAILATSPWPMLAAGPNIRESFLLLFGFAAAGGACLLGFLGSFSTGKETETQPPVLFPAILLLVVYLGIWLLALGTYYSHPNCPGDQPEPCLLPLILMFGVNMPIVLPAIWIAVILGLRRIVDSGTTR